MKKPFIILIVLVLSAILSSCATVAKDFDFSAKRDDIRSIEIYNIEKSYYEGDIGKMRQENEPICVLEAQNCNDFLIALDSLEFEEEKVFFPIPMDGGYDYSGYVIAIVYSGGGYDIVAEGGLFSYAIGDNGTGRYKYDHSDYCGEQPWTEFIEEYLRNE